MLLPLELMEEHILATVLQTSFSCFFFLPTDSIEEPSQGGVILLMIKCCCSTTCEHRGSVEQ